LTLLQTSLFKRFLNLIIDLSAIFIVEIILLTIFILLFPDGYRQIEQGTYQSKILQLGIYLLAFILYYTLTEGLTGKTLGKAITESKVVTTNGQPIKISTALKRTIIRLVPFEPFSFLFDSNLHDRLSNTLVVSNNFPVGKQIKNKGTSWALFISVMIIIIGISYNSYQKSQKKEQYIKKYTSLLYKGYTKDSVYINDTFGITYYIPDSFEVKNDSITYQIFLVEKGFSSLNFSVYYREDYPKLKNHSDFLFFINKEIDKAGKKTGLEFKPIAEGWYKFGDANFKHIDYKVYPDTTIILVEMGGMRKDIFLNIEVITNDSTDLDIILKSLKRSKFKGYIW